MKNIFGILLLLFVLTECSSNVEIVESNEDDEKEYSTTIYYSPHADDEILSMGPGILHNLALNKEVIVVLLSEGMASTAFTLVNEKLEKDGHSKITKEEFGQARVTEFQNSVVELGVREDNLYVYGLTDANFTSNEVASIISSFEEKYPNSLHNVMSYDDPHNDHAATGKALRGLSEKQEIRHALYYIPIQEHKNMNYDGTYTVPQDNIKVFNDALKAYGKWSPDEEAYSIGYMSVPEYFMYAQKSLEGRWHR